MKTVLKITMLSILLTVLSAAAFADTTPQEMPVSCTAPNPAHQTGLHRPKGDGNIWTFSILLEGGAHFVKGPYWSYPGKDGSDPDWGLWTGGADGDSSLGWSSPEKTGTFSVRVSGQIACGTGGGGAPIDFSAGWDGDISDYTLSISSDKTAICAGGVDSPVHQATITATLKDDDGDPVSGESIDFTLENSNGDYPASIDQSTETTDAQGEAVVTLTSSRLIGTTVKVSAAYLNETKETDDITSGQPDGSFTTNGDPWLADGGSVYSMTFGLSFKGQPVDGHELTWSIPQFTISPQNIISNPNTDYGQIVQSDNETGQDGKADAQYQAGWVPGIVTFQIVDQTALSNQ